MVQAVLQEIPYGIHRRVFVPDRLDNRTGSFREKVEALKVQVPLVSERGVETAAANLHFL
ncbi:hypothetical protein MCERH10_01568 [Caulobacteraceae bacterium]